MTIAFARLRGMREAERIAVDVAAGTVQREQGAIEANALGWELPTTGAVVGTLLNFRDALAALGDAVHAAPYNSPPRAPVLYLKPANTWIAHRATIPLPAGVPALVMGATLGVVIGRTACRVPAGRALEFVGGYTIVNDVCEPHASVYRPAIRQRCRDGFCAIGPWVVARDEVASPDALTISVHVNGELRCANSTAGLVRGVAQLIADVTEFMTLGEGDLLLVGTPADAPLAGAGDSVRIAIDGIGMLENTIAAEAAP
jgi:5-oxopent-3-ene-1,2,5-tricarboxylate decarboxylase/2-hydroxyhepta-2,4-diene-1,7-dioate isomerase